MMRAYFCAIPGLIAPNLVLSRYIVVENDDGYYE